MLSLQKGFTPLHVAAKYGHLRAARLLLKRGSDPNVEGRNGLTPLHVATHYSHIAVALMLMENGATPSCVAKVPCSLSCISVSFYRAMLCICGTSHGPVSVSPSVRHKSVFY